MSEHSETLLARMRAERGPVPSQFETMAKYDPRYLELFHETYMHVMEDNAVLSRKVKELILVAVDAATYYHYGTKFHMKAALAYGATPEEVMTAVTVAGVAGGIHVSSAAMPWLKEAVEEHEAAHAAK